MLSDDGVIYDGELLKHYERREGFDEGGLMIDSFDIRWMM